MTGVDIIGALLIEDLAVTTIAPAVRIKAGALPDNVAFQHRSRFWSARMVPALAPW
jgi:hypothetical protein